MRPDSKSLTLVTGNSSGDLDSLISSYVKSFLLRYECHGNKKIITMFRFPRSEWKLHGEAQLLFKKCGSDLGHVLFSDDISLNELENYANENSLDIILTDHNLPERELIKFSPCISEVIDHHKRSEPVNDYAKITISNTGSCSTLICEQFFAMLTKNPKAFNKTALTELANLLYFTIRVDTDHLIGNAQYDYERDLAALKKLLPLISFPLHFLKDLKSEKRNFSGYTLEDHLLKDYKSWDSREFSYGISTVYLSISDLHKDLVQTERLDSFMEKKEIEILFLMHSLKKPILKRELTVVFSHSFHKRIELIQGIKASELFTANDIEPLDSGKLYFFSQLDPDLSRKKIQPFLDQLLKSSKD